MGIVIDIVVVAIIVLVAILGIKRGFIKTLFGLLSIVIALVAAIFLTAPVVDVVTTNTEWDEDLRQELGVALGDKLPNSEISIHYAYLEGEEPELVFVDETTGEVKAFSEILTGQALWGLIPQSWLNEAADDILTTQAAADEIEIDDPMNFVSFRNVTSQALVNVIYKVAGFIAVFIVARILIWIILRLLKKLTQNVYIAYFIDKMLGGILGLALGAVIILVILTILQLLGEMSFMTSVNELLASTTVTRIIMDNNFLYDLLVKYVDLSFLK